MEYTILGNPEFLRNEVLFIKDLNIVLKIYGSELRWRREINALSMFQKEYFSPKLISFGMYEEYGWAAISYLNGESLIGILDNSTVNQKKNILFNLGVFLCSIHDNTKVSEGSECVLCEKIEMVKSHQYTYGKYLNNKEKILRESLASRHFEKSFDFIEQTFWKTVEDKEGYLTYFHNDFGARNIIWNNEKFYLIDYESGYFLYREFDLANIYFEYYDTPKLIDAFLGGYCSKGYHVNYRKVVLALLLKCIDICSWSKKFDKRYYDKAEMILTKISNNSWKLVD